MPKIAYISKRFAPDRDALIDVCNQVIANYTAQGYRLTLRQLYYQMIARDLLPESWIDREYNISKGLDPDTKNTPKNYKRLGDLINDARMAGRIDWYAIEDRGRSLMRLSNWVSPIDIIENARKGFRLDHWADQEYRVEAWVEKEAMEGVLERICNRLDVPFFASKGYNSQTAEWEAAQRFKRYQANGQKPVILYLGDHDPSGIDMTRDHEDRLSLFMGGVQVERLALNFSQVLQYNPPPNPAKDSDSRIAGYRELYGDDSWELDALEPQVISDLIEHAVLHYRDEDRYQATLERERDMKETLSRAERRWDDVVAFLEEEE